MKYISSTEAAKNWNITGTRTRELARNGRIPGAQLVGNSWMIPEDAHKPADGRTRLQKEEEKHYRFPLTMFGNYTTEEVKTFTLEEKALYKAEQYYCNCNFEMAKESLEDLLNQTKNINVKIGVLYYLCFTYLHTREFSKLDNSLMRLRVLFESDLDNKEELVFILEDLFSVFDSTKANQFSSKLDYHCKFSKEARIFMIILETCREVTRNLTRHHNKINTNLYELICDGFESEHFDMAAIFMHHYIGTMYQINKAIPEAKEHFLKAMRLAKKNNFHAPLLGLSFANFELYQSQLDEFSENERKKAKEYHRLFVEDYAAFLEYSGKNSYYRNITDDEFKFINYILLEVPNKKIAQTEKLSESTINKKLTVIYDKLNVSGRKELYDLVVSVISNKG